MPSPADWLALMRRTQRRLRCAQSRLAASHQRWKTAQGHCNRLHEEIALQRQLDGIDIAPGTTLDRARLFACLRKMAINRQYCQELQLRLQRMEEDLVQRECEFRAQQQCCRYLQARLEVRMRLLQQERRKRETWYLDLEESELEERKSWNK